MESLCIRTENIQFEKKGETDSKTGIEAAKKFRSKRRCKGLGRVVTEERKSNIKWNDVDHLDNISVMWDHFEQMDIKDRQEQIKKENGKGKEIEPNIETGRITTLEEMGIFFLES
ncbi:hypothetical protein E3N88_17541 [Mikania micrantha]|uniref:Uncharacterized protein n=1 Tax=Mikania micrantha TaxID=192012 RepID=A0A5N6NUE2_9ASTR|nr:hypothetical protein E3N88_17541 [Mikania micrantha]